MTIGIRIQEVEALSEGFLAHVTFGPDGAAHTVTIRDPHSAKQEAELAWYFEKWLAFPFVEKVRAKEAAASLRAYGVALYQQVFQSHPHLIIEFERIRTRDFSLEIVGSPRFHALHWEALQHPDDARPMTLDKPVVRKNLRPVIYTAEVNPADQLRILLVTARPHGAQDVSYRTISRPLVEALETAKVPAQIDMVRPGTFEALVKRLDDAQGDGYYHVLHLDMHGGLWSYEAYSKRTEQQAPSRYTFKSGYAQKKVEPYEGLKPYLFFNGDPGEPGGNPVSAEDLAALLKARKIPIVVLNACQSGMQVGETETSLGSSMLQAGVQLVVAMGYSVTVSAARLMMTQLYQQLLQGKSPAQAIGRARLELYHDKRRQAAYNQEIELEDWVLPVVYQNTAPHLEIDRSSGVGLAEQEDYRPPRTTYPFVGRDLDILELEQRLLLRRNLVLVRGMGGTGKTTLLHHVAWWWHKTRLVTQVFYFGYDQKAFHLQEIVHTLGKALNLPITGILKQDRPMVVRALKSTRHLLILDNLESVAGNPMAIPNTLPLDSQAELHEFLMDLIAGKSLLLLGSRGNEAWLRQGLVGDGDIYNLAGLDAEASANLAQAVMTQVSAPGYLEDPQHQTAMHRLLRLLGGYPLPIEVVLSGLAKVTPEDIVTRLQAADINLDVASATEDKTKSILACVAYSHSNLSPDSQRLLLCLAPFTGVVNVANLEEYTQHLKAQPALADLPFDQWDSLIGEAINWGLLKPHPHLGENGYLNFQPIFPYFLKTRLQEDEDTTRKAAIDAAFMAHYQVLGGMFWQLTDSKDVTERQLGQIFIKMEYENLQTALAIALSRQASIQSLFMALDCYFDQTQDHLNGLAFGNQVLEKLEIAEAASLDEQKVHEFIMVLDIIAKRNLLLKRPAEAKATYQKGLQLFESGKLENPHGKASLLYQLGKVAWEQRQWQEAEDHSQKALVIFLGSQNRYGQASTLHQLGLVAEEQRQWQEAEGYYQEALPIFEETRDRYGQASTLHQLGIVAAEQRQWQKAEVYYQAALAIYVEFQDRHEQAGTLHHLGIVAQKKEQWKEAEGYYQAALAIKKESQDRYSQAGTLHHLGIVAQAQQQLQEAEKYYQAALAIYVKFQDRYGQAGTLGQLGLLAEEQRKWAQAAAYGLEAFEIFVAFEDTHQAAIALSTLARIYQATQDPTLLEKVGQLLQKSPEEVKAMFDPNGPLPKHQE